MPLRLSFPWYYALLAHARGLTFIREPAGQPNAGEGVIACQKVTGNEPPASWCCSYAAKNQTDLWRRTWPLVLSGACEDVRRDYEKHGALWTIDQVRAAIAAGDLLGYPERSEFGAGWQFFTVATIKLADGTKALHAHHTGLVGVLNDDATITGWLEDGFVTTEGNAANPKLPPSDNGDGAYAGRVRGNQRPASYGGKVWPADPKVYHFGRPELLK
jgi:hypothetical protein